MYPSKIRFIEFHSRDIPRRHFAWGDIMTPLSVLANVVLLEREKSYTVGHNDTQSHEYFQDSGDE